MPVGKSIRVKEGVVAPTRSYSKKQEVAVAKNLGGRLTPNSGATPFIKGDVITDDWLIECKTQTKNKDSFTIKKVWFEKNLAESLYMGKKYSAVVFNFGPGCDNYYVIDENTFLELINKE